MTFARLRRTVLAVLAAGWAGALGAQTVDVVLTNSLVEPHSIAVDSTGTLYITDQGGLSFGGQPAANRVLKFVPTTGLVSSLAGNPTGARSEGPTSELQSHSFTRMPASA